MAAFAVAVLLALQTLLAAHAAAAGMGAPMVDAFGNPLCVAHMEEQAPAGDHALLPGCCALACGMAMGFAPPPARGASLFFNPRLHPSDRIADTHADFVRPARSDLQGFPRAPPQAA